MICALVASGCGEGPAGPGVGTVVVQPSDWLLVMGSAETVSLQALVQDAQGRADPGVSPVWTSLDPTVATVDDSGNVTAVAPGSARITATWEGVSGESTVQVWEPQEPDPGLLHESQFGREHYIEYIAGDLPLIVSAPHGGALSPEEISDRTWGVTATDRETVDQAIRIRDAFVDVLGAAPHLVISHLARTKLDPNREVDEAAQGSPFAALAWSEYHGFIELASEGVSSTHGWGLYLDLHGHGHDIQRVEVGYLLTAESLGLPAAALDQLADESSIRDLVMRSGETLTELIRGPDGMGSLLDSLAAPAVPSARDPWPGSDPYFRGGYSQRRHGSRDGGTVSGIQLELHWKGLRDGSTTRQAFAEALVEVVRAYLNAHLGSDWAS